MFRWIPAHTQVSNALKTLNSLKGVYFATGSSWPGDICAFLFSLLLPNKGEVEKSGVICHLPLGTLASYSSEGKGQLGFHLAIWDILLLKNYSLFI